LPVAALFFYVDSPDYTLAKHVLPFSVEQYECFTSEGIKEE